MFHYLLGLGSNIEDRLDYLNQALNYLGEIIKINTISSIYRSEAMTPANSPKEWNLEYFNLCLYGYSNITPEMMINHLQTIEGLIGRPNEYKKWAPRVIDIDILLVNKLIIKTERLTIPHPGFLERDFMLIPAIEIAGNWIHPMIKKQIKYCNPLIDTGCRKI